MAIRTHLLILIGMALLPPAADTAERFQGWVDDRGIPAVGAAAPLLPPPDLTPIRITVTTPSWRTVPTIVTVDRVGWDRSLWRQMHIGDWDRVPSPLRETALASMLRAYEPVLTPATWSAMTTEDWDLVPQPIRASAYVRMAQYWAGVAGLGAEFGLSPRHLGETVAAIMMAESWFEHRALNENEFGNRDLGLAQCSDPCRRTLAAMAAAGKISFAPTEDDYFNPLLASRVATVWFQRELHRANGDMVLAIRAYHRGLDAAMDEKGDEYLRTVERLLDGYIRTQRTSPAWRFLIGRITLAAATVTTTRTPSALRHPTGFAMPFEPVASR